jgi:hypothetical protein
MKLTTEEIRQWRDRCIWDRRRLNPPKVTEANERLIAVLNEVLEWRLATEAEQREVTAIPIKGRVI